jgi:hypothetical protein
MKAIHLRGLYGRPATRADWFAGKDFHWIGTHLHLSIKHVDWLKKYYYTAVVFLDSNGKELFRIAL